VGKVIASKIDDILNRTSSTSEDTTVAKRSFGSVSEWLQSVGLVSYLALFTSAGYDNIVACSDLSVTDLDNISKDILPGHRKTLLNASKNLLVAHTSTPNVTSNVVVNTTTTTTTSVDTTATNSTKTANPYVYKQRGIFQLEISYILKSVLK
jgi:hypothetical protein